MVCILFPKRLLKPSQSDIMVNGRGGIQSNFLNFGLSVEKCHCGCFPIQSFLLSDFLAKLQARRHLRIFHK